MKHFAQWLARGFFCLLLAPALALGQTKSASKPAKPSTTKAAPAASVSTSEATPDKTEAKPAAAAPASGGASPSIGADMPFKSIHASSIDSDSSGTMDLKDDVSVIGDDLSIDGNAMHIDPTTKLVTSQGTPCVIKMGDMNAWCNDFTYHMDTKKSHLEGHPKIRSVPAGGGAGTTMTGDIIDLTQDATGHVSWSIHQKKGSNSVAEIVKDDPPKSATTAGDATAAGAKPATQPAKKVQESHLDLLTLPAQH